MEPVVVVMSVLAFGIASGTHAYNVYEFRLISKEFREGNERLAKLIQEGNERLLKHMDEGHERIVRVLERMEKRLG